MSGDRFHAAKHVSPVFSSTFLRAKIYIARETFGNEAARGINFRRRNRRTVPEKNERCPGYEHLPKQKILFDWQKIFFALSEAN